MVATVGANLAHEWGMSRSALVIAWPALALVDSFELLMMLIRSGHGPKAAKGQSTPWYQPAPPLAYEAPLKLSVAPTLEKTVRARFEAGYGQRVIARELCIDRRNVKRILDYAAWQDSGWWRPGLTYSHALRSYVRRVPICSPNTGQGLPPPRRHTSLGHVVVNEPD
jgi:hypothetical protein